MGWPQITYIILLTLGVATAVFKDGETRKYSAVETLFATAVAVFLLYMGGFWS